MAFTPDFIDDVRSRLSLSSIIGKRVKLIKKGRRYSGLCPFHNEKTPSFSVNDDEGYYHCFGCGAGGDAITYLRETEGLDFTEAVKQLAEMAGVPIPEQRAIDPARVQKRQSVMDALGAAAAYYKSQLTTAQANAARAYLDDRGLSDATKADFQIGFAPQSGLRAHMNASGFQDDILIEAGLCGRSEKDNSLYDYFRNRIMFPICNRQGAVIAFGARAMGDAMPKYLNSKDGPTFSKKAVLYGWQQARERLRRNLPLLIVEGYMDVIAVTSANVAGALAPLGTAMTEAQIALAWKLHDEPVLCFDGDKAGQTAALRAIERLLPVLEPGKSARIAVMPEGKDPDDILKHDGIEAFKAIIASSASLAEAVWQKIGAQYRLDDPTSRTAFFQHVRDLVRSIGHNQTRQAYGDDMEFRIQSLRQSLRSAGGDVSMAPRRINRPQTGARRRLAGMLAILIAYPERITDIYEELSMVDFGRQAGDVRLESVKKDMLDKVIQDADLDAAALYNHLEGLGHAQILSDLYSDDIIARLGKHPKDMEDEKVSLLLGELLTRLQR